MRPAGSPLDLNNLPEEYRERYREGTQALEEGSVAAEAADSIRCRKKKGGGKEGKEECEKLYECRFCSVKFCKSQALGGHMNRHRQERETETLNRARQLVFSNEGLVAQGSHLGCNAQHIPSGFHQSGGMGDPALPFRSVYTGVPSPSSSYVRTHHPQPYSYPTSSSRRLPFPSPYPPPANDYYIGHVLGGNPHHRPTPDYTPESNYSCLGAPVTHMVNEERVNWNCTNSNGLDQSSIHRFRDEF